MAPRESDTNPYLQGNYAPWRVEGDAPDLEVIGELPRDLNGTFYRNGPNPAYEPIGRYHWFDGDGMIHAINLREGRASYRNRYVLSDGLKEERAAGRALYPGLLMMSATEVPKFKNTANTNIVSHAGKLLALMEAVPPTQLHPCTLDTIGVYTFDGTLHGPMTAHPKMDPDTGEMLFFGYSPFPPYLQYHVADRDGRLVRSEVIDIEWPSMIHDFAITKDYVVFHLAPLVFSFEKLAQTGSPFAWEPERGSRIGIMPRRGGNADVRWFNAPPCYIFHPMNAYVADDTLVFDVPPMQRMLFMNPGTAPDRDRTADTPMLHRWRLDLRSGALSTTQIDDVGCEFPRIDERRLGHRHRYGYAAAVGPDQGEYRIPLFTALHKYDMDSGRREVRNFGAENGIGEPLFVPRTADAAEDDGYVLVLAYDHARNVSEFHVLDARNIAGMPLATVRLPHRIPYGFHGNWVPAH